MELRYCCVYFVVWCSITALVMSKMSNVQVKNNGYTGLTVVISDKVTENKDIVNQLQVRITCYLIVCNGIICCKGWWFKSPVGSNQRLKYWHLRAASLVSVHQA